MSHRDIGRLTLGTWDVLRWDRELGCLPIPGSANAPRQVENLDIADLELDDDEMHQFTALGRSDAPHLGRLWGGDPATGEG